MIDGGDTWGSRGTDAAGEPLRAGPLRVGAPATATGPKVAKNRQCFLRFGEPVRAFTRK